MNDSKPLNFVSKNKKFLPCPEIGIIVLSRSKKLEVLKIAISQQFSISSLDVHDSSRSVVVGFSEYSFKSVQEIKYICYTVPSNSKP